MAISTGKKARKRGGNRHAIKRSKPKPKGLSRYAIKVKARRKKAAEEESEASEQ